MEKLRVKDILPTLSLARTQRVNVYASPEGMLLRTAPRDAVMNSPEAAVGKTIWDCEVIQLDACSPDAFNITIALPEGRSHI